MKSNFIRQDEIDWFCHPSPVSNIVYWQNPKVACSSIKKSLWKNETGKEPKNVHRRVESPFPLISESPSKYVGYTLFSVVRNPYTRVLSAYLDKIGKGSDKHVWHPFCRQFGISEQTTKEKLTFKKFLIMISNVNPNDLDPHIRPQSRNLLSSILSFDHIGYLEEFSTTAGFFEVANINYVHSAPHARNASEKLSQYYDAESISLVQDIYREDFYEYSYSLDINLAHLPGGKSISDYTSGHCFTELYTNFAKLADKDAMQTSVSSYYNQLQNSTNKENNVQIVANAIENCVSIENQIVLRAFLTVLLNNKKFTLMKKLLDKACLEIIEPGELNKLL